MDMDLRQFLDALGGYRVVAERLGKKPTTVHTHIQAGALPAAWYDAICVLARESGMPDPSRALFSFITVKGRKQNVEGVA